MSAFATQAHGIAQRPTQAPQIIRGVAARGPHPRLICCAVWMSPPLPVPDAAEGINASLARGVCACTSVLWHCDDPVAPILPELTNMTLGACFSRLI